MNKNGMKKTIRCAALAALVLILAASMTAAAAAKPESGKGGRGQETPGSRGARSAQDTPTYVYADDAGWVTDGWALEDYVPEGGARLLTGNDAGATATYHTSGVKHFEIYASRYWTCGVMEVWVDGKYRGEADLRLDADDATYGNLVYEGAFPGPANDPGDHILTLKPGGTGGPGIITLPDGSTYDLTWLHVLNVQYVHFY